MSEAEERERTIEAEAAEWVVRLEGGPLDAEARRAFEAWFAESEAHREAFDCARWTWAELGRLGAAGAARDEAADDGARGVIAHQSVASGRGVWRGLAAALTILVLAAGVFSVADPVTAWRADHRTARGEVRTVTLPDGSTAALNTRTAIAVDYDGGRREILLIEGEAAFTVAPAADAAAGPFVVAAVGGEARALGTRFVVRKDDAEADIAVLEHSVAVTPPAEAAGSVVLEAGEAVAYGREDGLGPVRRIDPARYAAWRRGRIVFDQVPLSEAVAELNRYRRSRIVVVDPDLAARRVSGVFRVDDLADAIDIIAAELGARTVSLPPFVAALY